MAAPGGGVVTKCPPSTCFTCRLAGLTDCMDRFPRLPLVEKERADVAWKTTKTTLLYPNGTGVTLPEALKIWRHINDRRTD